MKARGVPLLDETPRVGAGGCRVAFVHPKGAAGVLLELKEAAERRSGARLPVALPRHTIAGRRRRSTEGAGDMSERVEIGIIGGTGLYEMEGFTDVREVAVETPFGAPSDRLMVGTLEGRRVAFLPRHGRGHRILPHELNFRANVFAMKPLGVEWILSVSAVGSLKEALRAAPHRRPRPVRRPHDAAAVHLLRPRPRRPRGLRPPVLPRPLEGDGGRLRRRRGHPPRGRDLRLHGGAGRSRPSPSRSSTAPGAWTSSG